MIRCRSGMRVGAVALLVSAFAVGSARAQIFSDTFETAGSAANYNVYSTTNAPAPGGTATGTAVFGFDYSTLGLPPAPAVAGVGGGPTTLGLRVQSDEVANSDSSYILGSISVATKSLSLPAAYKLQVAVWGNYIGGATITDANGSNGTTAPNVATAVKGATFDSALTNSAANEGGLLAAAIRDPTGAGGTYRVYINGVNQGNTNGAYHIYAASAGSDSATTAQMYTNSYYASTFPSVSAPTVQSSAATTQTGTTPAGTFGFAWHIVTVQDDGTNTTWAIDNLLIATVPDSSYTRGGTQISLGDQDSNASASSAANGPTYNFNVFDNLVVTALAVPEPGSLGLLAAAGAGLLVRRWRRTV